MATKKVKKKQITDFKHDIRHDHIEATGDDKGKWIRANPDTGSIEYTDPPKEDTYKAYLIDHDNEISVNHNMGKKPSVTVLVSDGQEVQVKVTHIDENNIKVSWESDFNTFQGTLILN